MNIVFIWNSVLHSSLDFCHRAFRWCLCERRWNRAASWRTELKFTRDTGALLSPPRCTGGNPIVQALLHASTSARRWQLSVQTRCGRHNRITALLADYVNEPGTRVMFRLCQFFDVSYAGRRVAIGHLPSEQAGKVLNDVEARLIYKHQPVRNERYKATERTPWKPFDIELSLPA